MKKDNKEMKFQIELEVVDLRSENMAKRMIKTAEKRWKKLILNKIDGKMGEC
jgi:hypothetical protein